jgi:hypothetical protein
MVDGEPVPFVVVCAPLPVLLPAVVFSPPGS